MESGPAGSLFWLQEAGPPSPFQGGGVVNKVPRGLVNQWQDGTPPPPEWLNTGCESQRGEAHAEPLVPQRVVPAFGALRGAQIPLHFHDPRRPILPPGRDIQLNIYRRF